MIFGLDGVEIGLLIVFLCLFGGILSGFPVAFAIGGAAVISFGIIAALDSGGLLIHQAIDKSSAEFGALMGQGIRADTVSVFDTPICHALRCLFSPMAGKWRWIGMCLSLSTGSTSGSWRDNLSRHFWRF
jgi:hypothetical protein